MPRYGVIPCHDVTPPVMVLAHVMMLPRVMVLACVMILPRAMMLPWAMVLACHYDTPFYDFIHANTLSTLKLLRHFLPRETAHTITLANTITSANTLTNAITEVIVTYNY